MQRTSVGQSRHAAARRATTARVWRMACGGCRPAITRERKSGPISRARSSSRPRADRSSGRCRKARASVKNPRWESHWAAWVRTWSTHRESPSARRTKRLKLSWWIFSPPIPGCCAMIGATLVRAAPIIIAGIGKISPSSSALTAKSQTASVLTA